MALNDLTLLPVVSLISQRLAKSVAVSRHAGTVGSITTLTGCGGPDTAARRYAETDAADTMAGGLRLAVGPASRGTDRVGLLGRIGLVPRISHELSCVAATHAGTEERKSTKDGHSRDELHCFSPLAMHLVGG